MNRHRASAILTERLDEHPAVRAWVAATSHETVPEAIHVLRERGHKGLYWLPGLAPGGAAVFAKRAVAPRTIIERTIYEDVLPHLQLTAPHYYGSCVDDVHGWLFVEDVGDRRYSKHEPEHLALAARWFGTFHLAAGRIPAARTLPDAGPARYLTHLRAARGKMVSGLRSGLFPRHEAAVLEAVVYQCDAVETRWPLVEAGCENAPHTLVHGDFRPKNGYLRANGAGLSLFPIDWETAGFGPPATDMPRIDLATYWGVVREGWPDLGLDAVERLAATGRLLWEVAAVNWESEALRSESRGGRSHAVTSLGAVLGRLATAARAAGVAE